MVSLSLAPLVSGVAMRARWVPSAWVLPLLLVLSACATPPLAPVQDPAVSPSAAAAGGTIGAMQIWGGVVVEVRNLEDATWIQVVSYPLRGQEPRTGGTTDGRFLLTVPGFLDPVDHRVGRWLTARGRISGFEDGRIGEVPYRFPVLEVEQLHLWPDGPAGEPRGWGGVRFGIGIGIGL